MARSENMTRAEIAVEKVEEERENACMARSKNTRAEIIHIQERGWKSWKRINACMARSKDTPAGVTNANKHAIAKVEN